MSAAASRFAILGATPRFTEPLPVGQLYFPDWDRYVAAMRGIFERQYYTNHGPLAVELEQKLQAFLGVKHVIYVTNATIGMMLVTEALSLDGWQRGDRVIVPGFTFAATAQAISRCGLSPIFCDTGPGSCHITPAMLDACLTPHVRAVMAVNLWGGACDVAALEAWGHARGLPVYFDSAQAFGCRVGDTMVGNFGRAEVFSFHATKIVSAAEGGCIATNDDEIAARIRNMRSGYGIGRPVPVVRTSNGRISEAQAALALLSLEDYPVHSTRNRQIHDRYGELLAAIPGIRLLAPEGVTQSNFQTVACQLDTARFGLTRDRLVEVLRAENVHARRYLYPGAHRLKPYDRAEGRDVHLPNTEALCDSCFQLPIGAAVTLPAVDAVCALLDDIHRAASLLRDSHAA